MVSSQNGSLCDAAPRPKSTSISVSDRAENLCVWARRVEVNVELVDAVIGVIIALRTSKMHPEICILEER